MKSTRGYNLIILLCISFVTFLSVTGCNFNSTLDESSYIKWVENEDNGLRKEKTIGDIEYILQYKPYSYIALYELKNTITTSDAVNKRIEELSGMSYFNLRMKHTKGGDIVKYNTTTPEEFFARSSYFSFDMQYDIFMVANNDTLPCALFHEVKNYGIAPFVDFVIGFEDNSEETIYDKELIIQDRVFDNGLIKFQLTANSLKDIPSLKL